MDRQQFLPFGRRKFLIHIVLCRLSPPQGQTDDSASSGAIPKSNKQYLVEFRILRVAQKGFGANKALQSRTRGHKDFYVSKVAPFRSTIFRLDIKRDGTIDKSCECDKDRSIHNFKGCLYRVKQILSLSHSQDLSIMPSLLISRRKIVERNGATFMHLYVPLCVLLSGVLSKLLHHGVQTELSKGPVVMLVKVNLSDDL
jgi:hypothetical protein